MSCAADGHRCSWTIYPDWRTPDCCRRHIIDVMDVVAELLDREEVTWWIDYGTLLGHVRDGGFVPWDYDADIGVLESDVSRIVDLGPELEERGFFLRYVELRSPPDSCSLQVWRSEKNRNAVDLFPWMELADGTMDRRRYLAVDANKGRAFHRDRLFPLQRAAWEGVDVWVPADPEWFCAHRYGPDWRVPSVTPEH